MRIISWNVNGFRSVMNKGALEVLNQYDADIICFQETRCPEDAFLNPTYDVIKDAYPYRYIVESEKKGYAGVGIYSKYVSQPVKTTLVPGRAICREFRKFYLLNLYVPNSKPDLSALPARIESWERSIREFINELQETKPVIVVGDFNVAPTDLDIYMKKPQKTHGATLEEREAFSQLLIECNLIDTYRHIKGNMKGEWTWYSNFGNARANGNGWRIDLALVSKNSAKKIRDHQILSDVKGSDHIPIMLTTT